MLQEISDTYGNPLFGEKYNVVWNDFYKGWKGSEGEIKLQLHGKMRRWFGIDVLHALVDAAASSNINIVGGTPDVNARPNVDADIGEE